VILFLTTRFYDTFIYRPTAIAYGLQLSPMVPAIPYGSIAIPYDVFVDVS